MTETLSWANSSDTLREPPRWGQLNEITRGLIRLCPPSHVNQPKR